MCRREQKCRQCFGEETWWKETVWRIQHCLKYLLFIISLSRLFVGCCNLTLKQPPTPTVQKKKTPTATGQGQTYGPTFVFWSLQYEIMGVAKGGETSGVAALASRVQRTEK